MSAPFDEPMTTLTEGQFAVHLARDRIREVLAARRELRRPAVFVAPAELPPAFAEPRGVFVTLKEHPSGDLRGCIGLTAPLYPLATAIAHAAQASATEDPRFPAVTVAEMEGLTVEVSILTLPEPLPSVDPSDRAQDVVIGRDGLIVDDGESSGLLLPQVAPEQGWAPERFLAETCRKAGLRSSAWEDPRVRVRRFRAEIFHETTPGGEIVAGG